MSAREKLSNWDGDGGDVGATGTADSVTTACSALSTTGNRPDSPVAPFHSRLAFAGRRLRGDDDAEEEDGGRAVSERTVGLDT